MPGVLRGFLFPSKIKPDTSSRDCERLGSIHPFCESWKNGTQHHCLDFLLCYRDCFETIQEKGERVAEQTQFVLHRLTSTKLLTLKLIFPVIEM